ncbi:hypothetical protein CDAR_49571 [Caerostris darwini]|uniref:Uncharacterized protein n=1 Tax=Caerostris darwini TaxID=1538125 RepID=A0AAV4T4A2_9ARAC|nr:hypothetical protein CDAR_49571 [Caerostris darwini]
MLPEKKKKGKNGGMVHLERVKIEQKSSATFLLSQKLLMKMDEGLMGNILTRHSNKTERKNEQNEDGKRKEEKVSRNSYMCIETIVMHGSTQPAPLKIQLSFGRKYIYATSKEEGEEEEKMGGGGRDGAFGTSKNRREIFCNFSSSSKPPDEDG